MDVTQEIQHNHLIYGASDYTAAHSLASNKSFNYAVGNSIQKAELVTCNLAPFTHKFQSEVGLFGAENYFAKFKLNLQEVTKTYFSEPGWEAPKFFHAETSGEADWHQFSNSEAEADPNYEPAAIIPYYLPELQGKFISIRLVNNKTGNIYVDAHVDARLYGEDREEHYADLMYVRQNDCFYLGIHARNTKRLPFNFDVVVGEQILEYDAIEDKRYIMRSITAAV